MILSLGKIFSKRVIKYWNRLLKQLVVFKRHVGVASETWFSGGLGHAGLTIGLSDLGGFFHPK